MFLNFVVFQRNSIQNHLFNFSFLIEDGNLQKNVFYWRSVVYPSIFLESSPIAIAYHQIVIDQLFTFVNCEFIFEFLEHYCFTLITDVQVQDDFEEKRWENELLVILQCCT